MRSESKVGLFRLSLGFFFFFILFSMENHWSTEWKPVVWKIRWFDSGFRKFTLTTMEVNCRRAGVGTRQERRPWCMGTDAGGGHTRADGHWKG